MIPGAFWKKLFLLTVPLTLAACASMRMPANSVESVERARFVAMTRQDVQALNRMLAPDLTYCHSNGRCESKSEFLETIQTGAIRYKDIQVEQIRMRQVDKTTYVLNGRLTVNGEQAGQALKMHLVYTDIYVNRGGEWLLTAWQSTRLP